MATFQNLQSLSLTGKLKKKKKKDSLIANWEDERTTFAS